MTTLEKIRAEFISRYPKNYANEPELGGASCFFSLIEVLQIIDKYAEQEPKWIPISERLPEEDGLYLVYTEEQPFVCPFEDNGFFIDDVLAWMPLPKPYEPQESENKG